MPVADTDLDAGQLDVQHGLTSAEAARRYEEAGPNQVERENIVAPWRLFVAQFNSPVVWLLIAACVVSALLGHTVDAIAIGVIVFLNAVVGFVQEYRAERSVLALRKLSAPRARVVRDGEARVIPSTEVVPGDVLLLEAGDVVAADARLVEVHDLLVKEAMLTGESAPVQKSTEQVDSDAPLADRADSVFMGTAIAKGVGRAVVVATGMSTELGKIARLLSTTTDRLTPLQRRLARVSKTLIGLCSAIVILVAALGLWRGQAMIEVFMTAVSLAVAAVPEGLPAVVTVALALGVQRMVSRNVLVRRLAAVETLGCTTVICTDKTGTLTTGVMTVREVWGADHRRLLYAAAACSDAELGSGAEPVGDPTEIALLTRAAALGVRRADIESEAPRVEEHPFDSERKMMSILRADGVLYAKGALESILPLCTRVDPAVEDAARDMAERGLRVLAVAVGEHDREDELEMLGVVGIADPPRTEAVDAIAAARRAGIRTVMITGDHLATATAIARELGILRPGEDPGEVVHARATPQEKLDIVHYWMGRGDVVAMTGDGVNDAPALREADIGISMGITGTEVTREAADVILTDDNFVSIVAAVREGRGIFENIRKTLVYLLGGNAGELTVMLAAALVGLPMPLLPLHLLWINLVTDGLPALTLVGDPIDADVMEKPPRAPTEPMLGRPEWLRILFTGVLDAAVALSVFAWALEPRGVDGARSLTFSVLVFCELFRSFAARSSDRVFWEVGAFTNMRLLVVVAVSMLGQVALHHIPWTQEIFRLHELTLEDGFLAILLGLIPVTALEVAKLIRRVSRRKSER